MISINEFLSVHMRDLLWATGFVTLLVVLSGIYVYIEEYIADGERGVTRYKGEPLESILVGYSFLSVVLVFLIGIIMMWDINVRLIINPASQVDMFYIVDSCIFTVVLIFMSVIVLIGLYSAWNDIMDGVYKVCGKRE